MVEPSQSSPEEDLRSIQEIEAISFDQPQSPYFFPFDTSNCGPQNTNDFFNSNEQETNNAYNQLGEEDVFTESNYEQKQFTIYEPKNSK